MFIRQTDRVLEIVWSAYPRTGGLSVCLRNGGDMSVCLRSLPRHFSDYVTWGQRGQQILHAEKRRVYVVVSKSLCPLGSFPSLDGRATSVVHLQACKRVLRH